MRFEDKIKYMEMLFAAIEQIMETGEATKLKGLLCRLERIYFNEFGEVVFTFNDDLILHAYIGVSIIGVSIIRIVNEVNHEFDYQINITKQCNSHISNEKALSIIKKLQSQIK